MHVLLGPEVMVVSRAIPKEEAEEKFIAAVCKLGGKKAGN